MGSSFRSQHMSYCQMLVPPEAVYNCVAALGQMGKVQFKDLRQDVSMSSRTFYREVQRCEEMERWLQYLIAEMLKENIKPEECDESLVTPDIRDMMEMERTLEKLYHEVREGAQNWDLMTNRYFDTVEQQEILNKADQFLSEAQGYFTGESVREVSTATGGGRLTKLTLIAGVILTPLLPTFERLLWRVCQGNVFVRHDTISFGLFHPRDDDVSTYMQQSAFLVFFQGDRLEKKVRKICDSFHATIYPCPENAAERERQKEELATKLQESSTVLVYSQNQMKQVLRQAADSVQTWLCSVRQMKAVYHQLNTFHVDVQRNCFVGEFWVPTKSLDDVTDRIHKSARHDNADMDPIVTTVDTDDVPPTFHETNKFTKVFQTITDAYGIATYQELNPAPYAIVSFPFLFSLMFGDVGHGSLLACVALGMIIFEDRMLKQRSRMELLNMLFAGRYLILLMGLFSIHSGLMYNDIFSRSANIFGSAWYPSDERYTKAVLSDNDVLQLDPNIGADYSGAPYPFGMDPVWQLADNKITWLNSYKMKLSVIVGVSHMLYGCFLNLLNHIYFRDYVSIVFEFFPMVFFLMALFGYMDVFIVAKWLVVDASMSICAPSVLTTIINMFLRKHDHGPCSATGYSFKDQATVETALLIIIFLSVILLLVPKPAILLWKNKIFVGKLRRAEARNDTVLVDKLVADNKPRRQNVHADTEFRVPDVVINQAIRTVEYCLGCISHTASYLRLWALSLAHSELSDVLWHFFLQLPMQSPGVKLRWLMLFCAWSLWAALTVAILLLMEGLSAFLHTLRLHWVEFQSKFYEGDGRAFEPFYFKTVLEQARAAD